MQQGTILLHHADSLPKRPLGHASDVLTVNADGATLSIVKPQKQLD
jgi:hypothetical protein